VKRRQWLGKETWLWLSNRKSTWQAVIYSNHPQYFSVREPRQPAVTPGKACHHHHHNRFTALIPGPPGWASARRELLDFMEQGKINRGRHTDHPAGRHSIRTNQCPPPPSPHSGKEYKLNKNSVSVWDVTEGPQGSPYYLESQPSPTLRNEAVQCAAGTMTLKKAKYWLLTLILNDTQPLLAGAKKTEEEPVLPQIASPYHSVGHIHMSHPAED